MPVTSHHLRNAPAATLATVDTLLSDAETLPDRADLWPRVNALRSSLGGEDAAALARIVAGIKKRGTLAGDD